MWNSSIIIYHCSFFFNFLQDPINTAQLGIDWDGPLPPTDVSENTVYVDPPEQPLTSLDYQELCVTINPLDPSSEYGIELYIETLQFVLNKLHSQ